MSGTNNERDERPLGVSTLAREIVVAIVIILAVLRFLWPKSGIDVVLLAMLGAAAFLILFDVESIEWLGIRARRRRIEEATAEVEATPIPTETVMPPPPPDAEAIREASSHPQVAVRSISAEPEPDEMPRHPLERLLWAYERIRTELVILAGNSGHLPRRTEWTRYNMPELIAAVRKTQRLPARIESGIDQVRNARNEAVHEGVGPAVVKPASRLAVEVWEKLTRIRRNYVRVLVPDVELYADNDARVPLPERGVMIAQVSDEGEVLNVIVCPRESDYAAGRFVSWEWNLEKSSDGAAWYRDVTGEILLAYAQSATFIGREYPLEWGLAHRVPH